jgi:hypothetical protein
VRERLSGCSEWTIVRVLAGQLQLARVSAEIDQLFGQLQRCRLADRHRLRSRLRGLERAAGAGRLIEGSLNAVANEIERSKKVRLERLANLPKPGFPQELPVVERRAEMADVISAAKPALGKRRNYPRSASTSAGVSTA